jgi:two-component system, LytTR family, sensor kinase
MRARLRVTLLYALAWLILSLITTSQGVLTYLATGGQVRVGALLLINLALWLPWAVLTPLIVRAARRWPLTGPGWPRHVLGHVALNLALTMVAAVLYRALRLAMGIPVRGNYALLFVSGLNTSLLVYWGVVVIAHGLAYYRRSQERERVAAELDRQVAKARLDALRAQIHPHFLFNTLHAIASRVRADARGAEDMLGTLGDMLRVNLSNTTAEETSLREELELIDRYLAIQRMRLGERLRVEVAVDDSARRLAVPVLVLQPLVENAIEHGIAQRLDGGTLRIEGAVDGGRLVLRVSDDGTATADAADESRWHVGLTNTRERLRSMYGDRQSFQVARGADGGVIATVSIPAREAGDGMATR